MISSAIPQVLSIIKRRAIRKYKNQPIEQKKIDQILLSAMQAPSARNAKKWELIIVTDKSKIKKLGEMKPHSHHVEEAQVVIVVCSQDWEYWVEDCSIVAEHIWLETVNQGLSTCWTQIRNSSTFDKNISSEEYVQRILNIPKEIHVLCMMPIGYAAEKLDEHKSEELSQDKLHNNEW